MSWEQAVQWLRQQPDKAQLVIDCYYDDPLLAAAERYWQSEEWKAVRGLLAGRSGSALDVGAGRGIASYALAKDHFAVTALEPDPSVLVGTAAIRGLAAEGGVTINVCEEFSEHLPFESNSFDVVFARAVLHHTSDLKSACAEFYRVLKPGGIMLAAREHVISDKADLPAFYNIHPLHKLYGGENAFLLSDYKEAILEAGFTNLQTISPWQSIMNFAPHTPATLQHAVAGKLGGIAPLVRCLFNLPGVWPVMCALLAVTDRRPGRLYSFVASKPTL
jgi:ubiquinone/menaquinone biosynthesis C-methylase UbiE